MSIPLVPTFSHPYAKRNIKQSSWKTVEEDPKNSFEQCWPHIVSLLLWRLIQKGILFPSLPYHVFKLNIYFMILSQLTQQLVYEMHVHIFLFFNVWMQVSFERRLVIKEWVKEKGSTSNEGLKVELSNLVYTFVLHECGVLCWENRKE